MKIDTKKMKLVNSYELQKEFKDDAIRKITNSISKDATDAARRKKTYILIYSEK